MSAERGAMIDRLRALTAKWRAEAADGDTEEECFKTECADALDALLQAEPAPAQYDLPADAAMILRDNLSTLYDGAPAEPAPPSARTDAEEPSK